MFVLVCECAYGPHRQARNGVRYKASNSCPALPLKKQSSDKPILSCALYVVIRGDMLPPLLCFAQ
jgi:hypothetical protein